MQFSGSLSRYIVESTTELVFRRGVEYAKRKRVKHAREEGEKIKASVKGSAAYDVELWQEQEHVRGSCMCAYALNGDYCKHVVALAAYWDFARHVSLPSAKEVAASCLPSPHPRCLQESCKFCSWK